MTNLKRVVFVWLHKCDALKVVGLVAGWIILFREGLEGSAASALTFCGIGGERRASWSSSTERTHGLIIRRSKGIGAGPEETSAC